MTLPAKTKHDAICAIQCPFCGCTFRRRLDIGKHSCAAMQEAADLLAQPAEELLKLLPEDEQRAYRDAQQSVIDARRYAERHAHEWWIG